MWRVGDSTSRLLLAVAAEEDVDVSLLDTDELIRLGSRHGLLGMMADSGRKDVADAVVYHYLAQRFRQELMSDHLNRVLHSLHEAGVRATVLKGPYIAASYAHPHWRTFTDLDILVPEQELEPALEVLGRDPAVKEIPPKGPKADKRDVPLHDESGAVFNLDLHWDLFSYTQLLGSAAGATDWAWDHARPDPDNQLGPLWHLPPGPGICFLCAHALLDHRFRLILFRDLLELARGGEIDWAAVSGFAHRFDLRSTTFVSLLIARRLLGADIPDDVLADTHPVNPAMGLVELLLPRVDMVHFRGHRPHLLNLAVVLLHDRPSSQLRLVMRSPLAIRSWMTRVGWNPLGERVGGGFRQSAKPAPSGKPADGARLVLHVLPIDMARGAQTYAAALLEELGDDPALSHRSLTLFRSTESTLGADVALDRPSSLARRLGFDPLAATRLRRAIRHMAPAVVVAHGGEALKYAVLVRPSSLPIVYYKIGIGSKKLANPLRRAFYRWQLRRANVIAAVSSEALDEALNILGRAVSNALVIPNARRADDYWPAVSASRPTPRLVFVGYLTRTKRPEVFIDLVRALREASVDVDAWMIGDGPLGHVLRPKAGAAGIEMLGRRDDVAELLQRSDILVFTSLPEGEGMPGVLIEAGLSGIPVVATSVPGVRDVVEDGETGYVVDPDDFANLVKVTRHLCTDGAARSEMGERARERCLRLFTLEATTKGWVSLLDGLVELERT